MNLTETAGKLFKMRLDRHRISLLIGSTGYLGSRLLRFASDVLIPTTRDPTAGPESPIHFDLLSSSLFDIKDVPFDQVIIAAGTVQFAEINKDVDAAYNVNVSQTIRILQEAEALAKTVVFISSESVFDGKTGDYMEADRTAPKFHYARHKVAVEDYLSMSNLKHKIIRISKLYSRHTDDGSFLFSLAKSIIRQERILVAYDNIFTPIEVDDVVQWITKIIQGSSLGIFHLGGSVKASRQEIYQKLYNELSKTRALDDMATIVRLNDIPTAESLPLNTSLDSTKATKLFQPNLGNLWWDCTAVSEIV